MKPIITYYENIQELAQLEGISRKTYMERVKLGKYTLNKVPRDKKYYIIDEQAIVDKYILKLQEGK